MNAPAPHLCALERIRTIVVGTSLAAESDEVVAAAAQIARNTGARLALVHAIETVPLIADPVPNPALPGILAELERAATRRIDEQRERLGIPESLVASVDLVRGRPHREILLQAAALGAELIVVGAFRGGNEPRRAAWLGSTADRLARAASCPVLVVRPGLRIPPTRVLAPVDLSLLAADALRCGLAFLAQAVPAAPPPVAALFVLEPWQRPLGVPLAPERLAHVLRGELHAFLTQHARGAHVESVVRTGEVVDEVLAEVAARGADLLIVGTHGRSGVERLLLGSVASGLLRRASCSLLVVPPAPALGGSLAEAIVEQTAPDRLVGAT